MSKLHIVSKRSDVGTKCFLWSSANGPREPHSHMWVVLGASFVRLCIHLKAWCASSHCQGASARTAGELVGFRMSSAFVCRGIEIGLCTPAARALTAAQSGRSQPSVLWRAAGSEGRFSEGWWGIMFPSGCVSPRPLRAGSSGRVVCWTWGRRWLVCFVFCASWVLLLLSPFKQFKSQQERHEPPVSNTHGETLPSGWGRPNLERFGPKRYRVRPILDRLRSM